MWRGLMLTKAVEQFLRDVALGRARLPADRHAARHRRRADGARPPPAAHRPLIVTTPALAAQKVAQRAADMAHRSFLRVVGVIENMSAFTCDHGDAYALFGEGGGEALAEEIDAPLLGQVPLEPAVVRGRRRRHADRARRRRCRADVFRGIAARIVAEIAPPATAPAVDMAGCSARMLEAVEAALGPKRYVCRSPPRSASSSSNLMIACSGRGHPRGSRLGSLRRRGGSRGHRAACGPTCRISRNRHLVAQELAAGAGRDHPVRVGVLVGSLGDDEERQTEGERAPSVVPEPPWAMTAAHRAEHDGLRDVSVNHDVVGLGPERSRVVLPSHGDDQHASALVAHAPRSHDETGRDRGSRSFPWSHRRWACRRDDRATPAAPRSNARRRRDGAPAPRRGARSRGSAATAGTCPRTSGGTVLRADPVRGPGPASAERPPRPSRANRANGISDP